MFKRSIQKLREFMSDKGRQFLERFGYKCKSIRVKADQGCVFYEDFTIKAPKPWPENLIIRGLKAKGAASTLIAVIWTKPFPVGKTITVTLVNKLAKIEGHKGNKPPPTMAFTWNINCIFEGKKFSVAAQAFTKRHPYSKN